MAIKPNDCVIKLKDLVVKTERVVDRGQIIEKEHYAKYWENFLKHVANTTDWASGWDAQNRNLKAELAKFNAIYKETKKSADRYIKFKTHKDLTMFVLRWS